LKFDYIHLQEILGNIILACINCCNTNSITIYINIKTKYNQIQIQIQVHTTNSKKMQSFKKMHYQLNVNNRERIGQNSPKTFLQDIIQKTWIFSKKPITTSSYHTTILHYFIPLPLVAPCLVMRLCISLTRINRPTMLMDIWIPFWIGNKELRVLFILTLASTSSKVMRSY